MTIYIYNQYCTLAGQVCDSEQDYDDCTEYSGTPAELIELGQRKIDLATNDANGMYERRVGKSLIAEAGTPDVEAGLVAERHFTARNTETGAIAPATIYRRNDGSLVAYADEDENFDSPLGEITHPDDDGVDDLENSLT